MEYEDETNSHQIQSDGNDNLKDILTSNYNSVRFNSESTKLTSAKDPRSPTTQYAKSYSTTGNVNKSASTKSILHKKTNSYDRMQGNNRKYSTNTDGTNSYLENGKSYLTK